MYRRCRRISNPIFYFGFPLQSVLLQYHISGNARLRRSSYHIPITHNGQSISYFTMFKARTSLDGVLVLVMALVNYFLKNNPCLLSFCFWLIKKHFSSPVKNAKMNVWQSLLGDMMFGPQAYANEEPISSLHIFPLVFEMHSNRYYRRLVNSRNSSTSEQWLCFHSAWIALQTEESSYLNSDINQWRIYGFLKLQLLM